MRRQWVLVLVVLAGAVSLLGVILGEQGVSKRGGRSAPSEAGTLPAAPPEAKPAQKEEAATDKPTREFLPYGDRSLPHDEAIRGRVLDSKGEPIAGATVLAGFKDFRTRPYVRQVSARVRSEHDGFFVLGPLPRRNYYVLATGEKGGVAYAASRMPGAWVDLVLVPGARIEGTLTARETGKPVAGARVLLKDRTFMMETASDAEGNYLLAPLPPSTNVRTGQQLLVVADGFMPAERTNMVLETETSYRVDFRLEPGSSLAGKVVDACTLEPVGGAVVAEGWETYHRKTGSKPDGSFLLTHIDIAPNLLFTVRAQGYLPQQRQSDGTGRIEFRLDSSLTVRGTVLDLKDKPVAGARVYLHRIRRAPGIQAPSVRNNRTTTDPDGRFCFDEVLPGQVAVVAFHKLSAPGEQGPIEVPVGGPAPDPVEVRLRQGLTVTGEVRDASDQPIPSIQVRLNRGWGNIPGYRWARSYIWSENPIWYTDDAGCFELRGAVPGKHWLTAWDRTYGYTFTTVEGQEGQRIDGLVISFAGATIEGIFQDAGGKPVIGGSVYARGPKNTASRQGGRSVQVDGLGRFRLAGLKEGVYDITGSSPYGREMLKDVPAGSAGLVLKLKASQILRGAVTSALTGRAVQRYHLTIRPLRQNRRSMRSAWRSEIRTPDGRFERPLTAGEYTLLFKAAGHAPRQVENVIVEEGVAPRPVRVTLDGGGGIQGTVKDAGGNPMPNARVSARIYRAPGERYDQADWMLGGSDRADSLGRFFIQGLAPGTYHLETSWGSRGAARTRLVVQGIEMVERDLVLLPTGTVQLKVTDEEGQPVAGVSFQFTDPNGLWIGWAGSSNREGVTNSQPLRMGTALVTARDRSKRHEVDPFQITIEPSKVVVVEVAARVLKSGRDSPDDGGDGAAGRSRRR